MYADENVYKSTKGRGEAAPFVPSRCVYALSRPPAVERRASISNQTHCVLLTVECQHEPARKVRVREEGRVSPDMMD